MMTTLVTETHMNDIPTYILNAKQIAENTLRIKRDRLSVLDTERDHIKEEIRGLEQYVDDLCPLVCKQCGRGAWEPHRHAFESHRRGAPRYFTAGRITREHPLPRFEQL